MTGFIALVDHLIPALMMSLGVRFTKFRKKDSIIGQGLDDFLRFMPSQSRYFINTVHVWQQRLANFLPVLALIAQIFNFIFLYLR